MRQLLYVSDTRENFPATELDAVLVTSRRKNKLAGVTGLLLFMEGSFLQVLEGEATAVEAIYRSICADPRHWNAQTLLDQEAPRAFSQWSMGFERMSKHELGNETLFQISRDALARQLGPSAPIEIAILVKNFRRMHSRSVDTIE